MPAFVNSNVGSFAGTSDDECTSLCPFCTKKSRNLRRISDPVSMIKMKFDFSTGKIQRHKHRGHRGTQKEPADRSCVVPSFMNSRSRTHSTFLRPHPTFSVW